MKLGLLEIHKRRCEVNVTIWEGGVDWIDLALQDRDRWRALMNAVRNHRVQ
jgi:hypothetical protein